MKKAGIFAGAVFTASVMASLFYLGKQKYRKQFESQKIKELESVQSKPISVSQKWGRTSSIILRIDQLSDRGVHIQDFFAKYGYNNIAIYGMRELGEKLYCQLQNSGIKVKYVVDRHEIERLNGVIQLKPDDKWESVDAFVVTNMLKFDELENEIAGRLGCPVVSIEEILMDLE